MISIIPDPKEEVPIEVLATSIRAIAAGVKALRKGPLNEKTLLLLISQNCHKKNRFGNRTSKVKVSPATIKTVLDAMEDLQRAYLK